MSDRIAVLELRSVRGTGGGPEKTILLGAERRDRARFDVTVCYIRDERDQVFGIDRRVGNRDIDYVEIRERNSWDRRIWRDLTAVVRDRRIRIVHAHEYKTDLLAWLLAQRTPTIPLSTAHGWTGHGPKERWVYYPLDKRVLARFPRVIAVSSEIKQELERHGAKPDRVTVILNGIDPDVFRRRGRRAEVRDALGFTGEHFLIGAVGRVERQKRFDLLLDAVHPLMTGHPELRIVIVGDGSLRAELEARAQTLGLSPHCLFTGHRDDIAALHEAFDLFVQSSDYEGTPNAVLEAMAMETPVVATDAGGTAEIAIDGVHGLIVRRGRVEGLTAAIKSVLDDPAGARGRAVAARSRVETDLSFGARTRKLERVYLELCGLASSTLESRVADTPHA